MLHCCWRQYLWSGDRRYLDHPVMRNFYARTVVDYVQLWDKDGDGIPEHYPAYGRRGIGSYNEAVTRPYNAGDLIATQAAAYDAYGSMLELTAGEGASAASAWHAKAKALRAKYDAEWWCAQNARFAGLRRHDLSYECSYCDIASFFPLYLHLIEDREKAELALAEVMRRRRKHCIEDRSYLPELFYAYGHPLVARDELMEQLEPRYARREYPEVSYAAIGSIVAGMLGIAPDARTQTVSTCSRLTDDVAWVQITSLPCLTNVIDVRHDGQERTIFTNRAGPTLHWQAVFPGHHEHLLLDGVSHRPHLTEDANRRPQSVLKVQVPANTTRVVSML